MTTKKLLRVSFLVTGVVELEGASEGLIANVKGVKLHGPDVFQVGSDDVLPVIAYQLVVKAVATDLVGKLRVGSSDGEIHRVVPDGNTQPPGAA